jgi:hypothetical protein
LQRAELHIGKQQQKIFDCLNEPEALAKIPAQYFKSMKKIFLATILLVGLSMNAKIWNVTTTCGVTGTINIVDNATMQQVTDAVATYNFMHCGSYPKKVTLTLTT